MGYSGFRSCWSEQGASPLHPDRAARCRCRGRAPMPLRGARGWRRQTRLQLALYAALREREGLGGEKAATCAASLPVPNFPNISSTLCKLSRLCQCSASGKSEQKREVAFPQKSGKTTSRYCGSSSLCRPTALPHRLVPGTGTLPDAGGAARGGHAPRIPPRKADHRKIHPY